MCSIVPVSFSLIRALDIMAHPSPVKCTMTHILYTSVARLFILQGDFIGKKALLKQKTEGVKQMLGTFKVDIPISENVLPWGKELIYRNGLYSGYVTSAGYGFSIEKPICMGFVLSDDGENVNTRFLRDGEYEIEIDGRKWASELTLKAFYDYNSINMKA